MLKKTVKLAGILFAITFITALLLALTNEFTKDKIADIELQKKNSAMEQVIEADKYIPLINKPGEYELYSAEKNNGLKAGYAVSLSEYGYGGEINMTIGITSDHAVSGISINSMSETPGLGANAKNPEFTNMFKGLAYDEVALKSDGGKIEALSGATITSRAVTNGVKRALDIVKEYDGGKKSE